MNNWIEHDLQGRIGKQQLDFFLKKYIKKKKETYRISLILSADISVDFDDVHIFRTLVFYLNSSNA